MEGPLETFETPKQDKMISLIAWLIIACLLFYLAVFTFESFLRKSPWFAVTQEISGSEQFETSFVQETPVVQEPIVEDSLVEEVNAFASFDSESISNQSEIGAVGNQSSSDSADMVLGGSELSSNNSYFEENTSLESDKQLNSVANPAPAAAEIVEGLVSSVAMFQLKLENTFASRTQTFQFLKEMDFGDLDISLEIVSKNDVIHVLIGGLMGEAETGRIEKYLKARNHGLRLISISEAAGEVFFQASAVKTSPVQQSTSPGAGGLKDFEAESRLKPYTIQIGSFLSRRNAVILQEKMEEKGHSSTVEDKLQGSTYHYRVLVGNYASRDEATNRATKLSESDDVPVFVRTYR